MQRATTALEAAGLVRKKSAEAVREERERRVLRAVCRHRVVVGDGDGERWGEGEVSRPHVLNALSKWANNPSP